MEGNGNQDCGGWQPFRFKGTAGDGHPPARHRRKSPATGAGTIVPIKPALLFCSISSERRDDKTTHLHACPSIKSHSSMCRAEKISRLSLAGSS